MITNRAMLAGRLLTMLRWWFDVLMVGVDQRAMRMHEVRSVGELRRVLLVPT